MIGLVPNCCVCDILHAITISSSWRFTSMSQSRTEQWPNYTYIVPQIYTKAKVRLIGLGTYAPSGIITNEFFASISTRLGNPRSAEDLERVTGLSTRHVRASTLELCRKMAGTDAPGLIEDPGAPKDETLVDMAVSAAPRGLVPAGCGGPPIDTGVRGSSFTKQGLSTHVGPGPVCPGF